MHLFSFFKIGLVICTSLSKPTLSIASVAKLVNEQDDVQLLTKEQRSSSYVPHDIESQSNVINTDIDEISTKIYTQLSDGELDERGRAGGCIKSEIDPNSAGPFVYPVELEYDHFPHTRGVNDTFTFSKMSSPLTSNKRIIDPLTIYNTAETIKKCLQDAQNGDMASQTILGILYQNDTPLANGKVFPKNMRHAIYWNHMASKNGSLTGSYNLGLLFAQGDSIRQNYAEAFQCFKSAAEGEHVKSMFMLAEYYRFGIGVKANYKEALAWYEKAAQGGSKRAKMRIKWEKAREAWGKKSKG